MTSENAKRPMITPAVTTDKELAKYLKISLPTIHRWRKADTGPRPIRMGKCVRYRVSDVDAYLDGLAGIPVETECIVRCRPPDRESRNGFQTEGKQQLILQVRVPRRADQTQHPASK